MDYSKYHFNYFDVIKRHERIINRLKDWEVKVLAIIMLMVTFLYTFTNFGFCSEEELSFTRVANLTISPNSNVFTTGSTSVGYLQLEPNYIYTITLPSDLTVARYFAISTDIPVVDGTYEIIGNALGGEQFIYRSNSSEYLYLDYGTYNSSVTVTRRKAGGQDVAVNDLVDNVGINQIWDTFGNGVDFIGVVVLVAFGLFLVVLAIRKVSKGKSEF